MKSESEIEDLLRNAPSPEPAPGLREQLKNQVHLPQSENGSLIELGQSLWRRWIPAIAYAVMVLGCVVVLAVQNVRNTNLIDQLDKLREEVATKEELLEQQRERARLAAAANAKIKTLQGNAAEADQLATTLAELKSLIAQLTAEAAELEAKLAEVPENNEVIAPYDFFNDPDGPMQKAREEVHSIKCVNNMRQIGLSFRVYAQDMDGQFPPNFNSMNHELVSPTVLCCPSDQSNLKLAERLFDFPKPSGPKDDWSEWESAWKRWPINGGSYDMLGADLNGNDPTVQRKIIARCRFHGHVAYGDGSVLRSDNQGGFHP